MNTNPLSRNNASSSFSASSSNQVETKTTSEEASDKFISQYNRTQHYNEVQYHQYGMGKALMAAATDFYPSEQKLWLIKMSTIILHATSQIRELFSNPDFIDKTLNNGIDNQNTHDYLKFSIRELIATAYFQHNSLFSLIVRREKCTEIKNVLVNIQETIHDIEEKIDLLVKCLCNSELRTKKIILTVVKEINKLSDSLEKQNEKLVDIDPKIKFDVLDLCDKIIFVANQENNYIHRDIGLLFSDNVTYCENFSDSDKLARSAEIFVYIINKINGLYGHCLYSKKREDDRLIEKGLSIDTMHFINHFESIDIHLKTLAASIKKTDIIMKNHFKEKDSIYKKFDKTYKNICLLIGQLKKRFQHTSEALAALNNDMDDYIKNRSVYEKQEEELIKTYSVHYKKTYDSLVEYIHSFGFSSLIGYFKKHEYFTSEEKERLSREDSQKIVDNLYDRFNLLVSGNINI